MKDEAVAKSTQGYAILKGQWSYWKLFIGSVVSRFGDSVDAIAYTWLVYSLTGSASWSAIIFGVNALPSIILQPLAAPVVERMNKKLVMILADLGRAMIVAVVAALYILSVLQPYMLIIATLLTSSFEAFRNPAGTAIYPKIVSKEAYPAAMSLSSSAASIAEIIGKSTSGVIIAAIGLGGAFFIDGATFIFSAFMISLIRLKKDAEAIPSGENAATGKSYLTRYLTDLKEGFLFLRRVPVVLLICIIAALLNLFFVPGNALMAAYADLLNGGPAVISTISVSLSVGMLLGSLIYPYISQKIARWAFIVIGSFYLSVAYVMYVVITYISIVWLMYVVLAAVNTIFGIFVAWMNLTVSVAFMEHVEQSFLARAGSIMSAMCMCMIPVGAFLVASTTAYVSVTAFMLFFSVLVLILSVTLLFIRTLRKL